MAKGMFLSVGCDVFGFQGRSQNFEKRLLASSCLVYPSVRMEQLCLHWTDFDET